MTTPRRGAGLPALRMLFLLIWFLVAPATLRAEAAGGQPGPASVVAVSHCKYPPVSFWDSKTDRPAGFFVDVMNGIARESGLQVNHICRNSWPEMIRAIESGEADLGVLMRSEEREKILLFTQPIEVSYLSYFTRKHSSIDSASLPGSLTTGVVAGGMAYEQLKNRQGVKLETEVSYQEGLFQLLAGRIDLLAGEESMILKSARDAGLDDRIKTAGKPFAERERCLAVRKGRSELLGRLNNALAAFVGGPEYQRIYLAWYGAPTIFWTTKRILLTAGFFIFITVCGMAFWRYRSLSRINRDLLQEIAWRRKVEGDLELFRNLINRSNEAIFVNDPGTGRFIDVNERACDILGYDRNGLLQRGVRDIEMRFPDTLRWQDHVAEVKRRGYLLVEGVMKRKNGSTFPVETNVSYVTVGSGEYMIAVARDISERMQADAALRERELLLSESQRMAHIGSWEHNLTTGQVVWSDELFRLIGLDPGKDPADFNLFLEMIHPDDRLIVREAIDETVRSGRHFSVDYRIRLRDETERIIHAQAELRHDESGKQVILHGTAQDITEQKIAEEQALKSERFIRNILDTVDEGFIVIDRDYRIMTANKAYCGQAGLACDKVIGRHCYEISHSITMPCYDQGEECAVRVTFATGEPHTALHKHADQEGHVLYVETKAFPIKDPSGSVTSVIETINNITEKHLLEEERLKTQKLECIGTLAGGIAHDFNNLLQGVFGYISMAKLDAKDPARSMEALNEAEKALHLTVKLTNQLLTFSKGGRPVKRPMDLRPLIESAVKFALSGSRSGSRVIVDDDLWLAEADDGQLAQVIQNIVLNADQAMPVGGTVDIAARNVVAPAEGLPRRLNAGRYVEIAIRDAGIGIPGKYLDRIFDPYFTTKEKGSGLGLATSYSIVRNHGGTIQVRSEVGKGTEFLLYLPASAARTEAKTVFPAPAPNRRGRVLVMDDEEFVRRIAGRLIEALGHATEFAQNGEEAIAKYRSARDAGTAYDIVILDLTVRGGLGGLETLRSLQEIDPQVTAVMSSGYSDDSAVADYRKYGFHAFLKKPYTIEMLQDVLARALSAS